MIYVATGRPGEGKSVFLTTIACLMLRKGYDVMANFPMLIPDEVLQDQKSGSLSQVSTMEALISASARPGRRLVVILDEIHLWFNSREWEKVPLEVQSKWQQHRKDRIDIVGAAQDISRMDKALRQLIQVYWSCSKHFSRFIMIREFDCVVNGETQAIEQGQVMRTLFIVCPVKLDDPYIRFGFFETLLAGWRWPFKAFDTHAKIGLPSDKERYQKRPLGTFAGL